MLVPRADHASLRETVQASQHGRMLVAMSEVVGEKGYAAATVADVLRAAGVSRRTFYEHFSDKEDCLLAAYDFGAQALADAIAQAIAAESDWEGRARAAVGTYLELLAAEPGFARAYLVEIWAAGPVALERHRATLARFHALVRALHEDARRADPGIRPATETEIAAVAGGIGRVATLAVLDGRAKELPGRAGEVLAFALAVIARR